MIRKLLLAIICTCTGFTIAQQLNIKVYNSISKKSALASLECEKISFIDTLSLSNKGEFKFNFNEVKSHRGFYRLSLINNKWIDFIYDIEDVNLETDAKNILDSLKVIVSESNRIYYSFVKLNKDYKTKTELLQLVLARYPKEDSYYQSTKEKLIQIQEDYLYFVNVTSQVNPNSFIARYVASAQLPVVEIDIPFNEQLTYLKTHALDNVNFDDDDLIYSDAFTDKTIEYLTYYRNPQLPLPLLEKEFMTAVDSILSKAKVNLIVYEHIVEYLIDGFKKYGFDNVINYIVENYVIKDDLCIDETPGTAIEKRIQQGRNFKIGNKVPDVILPDSTGSLVELSKINSDKILIVFYASWCPHCKNVLPKINEVFKDQKEKKFEVIAISLDTIRTDWLNFIRSNDMDWINVSDLKGWDGKVPLDYFIFGTPTMFLINKSDEVIGRPKSVEELEKMVM
ncbi:TlpA family protein disulfide reductase [bacterium BMS3Abin03]|nr:TlpA family protein disulfide reductase [bacterium BMS3Abin03]